MLRKTIEYKMGYQEGYSAGVEHACLSPSSTCSSEPASELERQDAAQSTRSEAEVSAFKPVCEQFVKRFASELVRDGIPLDHALWAKGVLEELLPEIQRELTEKANSTPA